VALLWLFGVFIITQRVVSARPRIDAETLMLTTVSARTAVGGLLVAETCRVLAYLGLPLLVLTGSSVYLFTAPLSVISIPLAAVLLGGTAVVSGMALGYAIALLIATSPLIARYKTLFGGVAALLAVGGYLAVTLPQFGGIDEVALAVLPVGWFIDLAVVGSPVEGSLPKAGVALVGSLVLVGGGIILVEHEATRLWFTDPVTEGGQHDQPPASAVPSRPDAARTALADAITPVGIPRRIAQPTRRVAQWTVLRTRRDPRRLNFLLLPVVMVGSGLLSSGIQAESPWALLAPASAVVLPWVAGATFGMNPFGDEGAVLPVTLTSTSGVAYVRGVMLPGLLLGLPSAVLVTASTALVGPFAPLAVLGLVAASALTTLVAVTTAPTVGLWFPRFSAISIGQSREVVPPRLLTTVAHFLGITIPGSLLVLLVIDPDLVRAIAAGAVGFLPAVLVNLVAGGAGDAPVALAMWFRDVGLAIQSVAVGSFRLAAGGLFIVGVAVVLVVAYRLSVRRFDRYSPPM
jgi:hypothetical protein